MSIRAMGQAATTMNQLQKQMDIIGHNLANSQTAGYKSRQAEFSSLLFQQINNLTDPANAQGRVTPDGIRVGTGARLGAVHQKLSLGAVQTTDRELDTMLLNEHDFFQVLVQENGAEEIRYTRDGAFYLTPVNENEVMLVTRDGHPVYGTNGPIQFNRNFDSIYITENGSVVVTRGGQNETVGTLAIVRIERSRLLEAVGDNLFRFPNLNELGYNLADLVVAAPQTERLIQNQALEMSNVSIQDQMTQLITAQRSYQFNARTITMADQMQGLINQLR